MRLLTAGNIIAVTALALVSNLSCSLAVAAPQDKEERALEKFIDQLTQRFERAETEEEIKEAFQQFREDFGERLLKHLGKPVFVWVEDLDRHSKHLGLTVDLLESDVEFEFLQASIGTVDAADDGAKAVLMAPTVYVQLRVQDAGKVVFHLNLEVHQAAYLATPDTLDVKEPKVRVTGKVWGADHMGATSRKKVVQEIRSATKKLVRMFLEDYSKMNPAKHRDR